MSLTREGLLAIGAAEPQAGTPEALAEAEREVTQLAAKVRLLDGPPDDKEQQLRKLRAEAERFRALASEPAHGEPKP